VLADELPRVTAVDDVRSYLEEAQEGIKEYQTVADGLDELLAVIADRHLALLACTHSFNQWHDDILRTLRTSGLTV
jgi:hypothetical protein